MGSKIGHSFVFPNLFTKHIRIHSVFIYFCAQKLPRRIENVSCTLATRSDNPIAWTVHCVGGGIIIGGGASATNPDWILHLWSLLAPPFSHWRDRILSKLNSKNVSNSKLEALALEIESECEEKRN